MFRRLRLRRSFVESFCMIDSSRARLYPGTLEASKIVLVEVICVYSRLRKEAGVRVAPRICRLALE
jgi:hypothetical protein